MEAEKMDYNKNKSLNIPMMVLKDMVIMPGTNVHFDVQRDISVKAVNIALEKDLPLFVTMAKGTFEDDSITMEQLYAVGTLVRVKQVLKLQKGLMRVMFQGIKRAQLSELLYEDGYYHAQYHAMDYDDHQMSSQQKEASIRTIHDVLKQCEQRKVLQSHIAGSTIYQIKDLDLLMDVVTEAVPMSVKTKQQLLEKIDLQERLEFLLKMILNELSIFDIRAQLGEKLKDCVNQNQKEYVLREQMKVIRKELGDDNTDNEGDFYRERLEQVNPPQEVCEKLEKEIKRFCTISSSSSESAVLRNYIETLLEYPWNYSRDENFDLNYAIEKLESNHYGLKDVKDRIIDYLAVRILSGRKDAPILCLVGPPGTGKTSIAKTIASALGKEYGRIALGGVRDEAEIRGHRKTYVGAMPGRIVNTIQKTGVKNPLILLDEIDKTSSDHKGDVASALLEVLDSEQNVRFTDHYFEVPVDLSSVLFIATANDAASIPAPLRDRMEMIEVNSYTENEKFEIAKRHLYAKQLVKNGLTAKQFKITDEAMYILIRNYTREAGVRNLERTINTLMQKAARGIVTQQYKSITVNPKKISTMLGVEKYQDLNNTLENKIGVVNGLAWTKVGGDTLSVEVNVLDGKGGLVLTGNLGDVMKESAQIALSYVRTLAEIKKFPDEYFEKHVIHVHVPEGATPKDGPSAGIAMALAIYSALMNRYVQGDIAMTGELSLKGNVLPIGGLKEKLLAAKNAGMKKVLVPDANRKKVEEIDAEITQGMEIVFVSHMTQVIEQAIAKTKIALKM